MGVGNSGGHPGLLQALFSLIKEKTLAPAQMQNLERLAKQELVSEEFRKISDGLLDEERDALKKIAHGDQNSVPPLTGKLLVAKGMVKPLSGRMTFFSPLFGYWLK